MYGLKSLAFVDRTHFSQNRAGNRAPSFITSTGVSFDTSNTFPTRTCTQCINLESRCSCCQCFTIIQFYLFPGKTLYSKSYELLLSVYVSRKLMSNLHWCVYIYIYLYMHIQCMYIPLSFFLSVYIYIRRPLYGGGSGVCVYFAYVYIVL